MFVISRWILALVLAGTSVAGHSASRNGFALEGASIPVSEIHSGGPGRDGIPAIDRPRFASAGEARWLRPADRVIGVSLGDVSRAYPVRILDWHEIVNDRIGGRGIVVTWCPLCGSGAVFASDPDGRPHRFGVSGLLYNSDVLLYDRETESLWSQLGMEAVSGPLKGRRLELLPASLSSWQAWRTAHPRTQVLSRETGFRRDYGRSPYGDYAQDRRIWFPVAFRSQAYHPKERVLGLVLGSRARAYPYSELDRAGGPVKERIAGRDLTVRYDPQAESAQAFAADGSLYPTVSTYWFAWYAFHPDTEVFKAKP